MSEVRQVPADAAEQVAALPRRTAHAAYALFAWVRDYSGPAYSSEVVIYDPEAPNVQSTGSALACAKRDGLAENWGAGLWSPTLLCYDLAAALEARFLAETEEPHTTQKEGETP